MALVALRTNSPFTIVLDQSGNPEVFTDVPNPLRLPDGNVVSGVDHNKIPWTSQDGKFSLVAVPPFVPPNGQSITGSPSYAIDGSGNVTQTFATTATPPAPIVSVTINSTGTPAINGTYGLDQATKTVITELLTYTQIAPRKFPGGLASMPVADINGAGHLFPTVNLFTAFAEAYIDFVSQVAAGQTPAQPVVIA